MQAWSKRFFRLYGNEHSPEMAEIVRRICKNSSIHDPRQVQRFILDIRRRYEVDSYLDNYLTQDGIVDRLILVFRFIIARLT